MDNKVSLLQGFNPVEYINEPRWRASRPGLGRIVALMERLGNPQDSLRFVHVAGTNGKGSTCAYIANVLQAAGYKVGLFTSPYIETFEERIRVNGNNIAWDDLCSVTLDVQKQAEALAEETGDHATEFELMTAVALLHFARSACDIVVLEVGLGGKLDSTNVIKNPEVCVIARIGLDHTDLLGNTLAEIAAEKAGIIKPGVSVVTYPQEPEARDIIAVRASECGCDLHIADFSELSVGELTTQRTQKTRPLGLANKSKIPVPTDDKASDFDGLKNQLVRQFTYREHAYTTRLLGSYQPENAALAIEAIQVLKTRGWNITEENFQQGIAQTVWPGRFEVVPYQDFQLIIDGGHNPQGAEALANSLKSVFPGEEPVFIMSVLADKDYPAMIQQVIPLTSGFVCTTPNNPRALSAEELATAIRSEAVKEGTLMPVQTVASAEEALEAATKLAHAANTKLICVFGSLYSVGEYRKLFYAKQ